MPLVSLCVSIRPRLRSRGKHLGQFASGAATKFQSAPGCGPKGNLDTRPFPKRCKSFNPPPVAVPGETPDHARQAAHRHGFNPPPVAVPGETPLPSPLLRPVPCFNPPPVAVPGETALAVIAATGTLVSIRPRLRSRGKPEHFPSIFQVKLFQSAPGCG